MTMNRIVMHHTGGEYTPNGLDKRAYHRLTTGDGEVINGQFPISANAPGKLVSGAYAAHTASLNGGSIGSSLCSMAKALWSNPKGSTAAFPKPGQVDAFLLDIAKLSKEYNIPVTRETILSHAEVEPTLKVKQSGKWDFDYDIWGKSAVRNAIAIGDELRKEISRQISYLPVTYKPPVNSAQLPILKMSPTRNEVAIVLQNALNVKLGLTGVNALDADGIFGPKTREAVIRFQLKHQLYPDGIVGKMTWEALNL